MDYQSCKWNVGEWSSNEGLEGISGIKVVQLEESHQVCIPLRWERQRSNPTNFGNLVAKESKRDGKGEENKKIEKKQSTYVANTALIEREEWSKKGRGIPGKVLQQCRKVFLCYQNIYHGLQDGAIQGIKILKAINLISRKQISPTVRRPNFVTGQKYILEKFISCHCKDG